MKSLDKHKPIFDIIDDIREEKRKILGKQKPKELDWHVKWDYLLNKKKWKNPDEVNKVLTKFVEDLLTQQRTEIENYWLHQKSNDHDNRIREDERTEILEEYFEKEDNLIVKYANLKDDNWDKFLESRSKLKINLLNKKDE